MSGRYVVRFPLGSYLVVGLRSRGEVFEYTWSQRRASRMSRKEARAYASRFMSPRVLRLTTRRERELRGRIQRALERLGAAPGSDFDAVLCDILQGAA